MGGCQSTNNVAKNVNNLVVDNVVGDETATLRTNVETVSVVSGSSTSSSESVEPPTCPICLGGFTNQDNEVKYKTRCCHNTFHNSCIRQWANKNTSCPMCRKDLSVPLKNETIIKIQNMIINELLQDLINSPEGTEFDELVGEDV